MKITRDSFILWVGILSGVATVIAAQADLDLFPPTWKPYITVIAALLATISGTLATSPLPGEKKY